MLTKSFDLSFPLSLESVALHDLREERPLVDVHVVLQPVNYKVAVAVNLADEEGARVYVFLLLDEGQGALGDELRGGL